ncbi:MAG: AIR synthase-related protein [Patescibacteria group bacterium]|nr:AIR synthase-related protein [Patescibacteria group bacterium]
MDQYRNEVIDPGDAASKLAHQVCVASYNNSPLVRVVQLDPGNFRGGVGFRWQPKILEAMLRGKRDDQWEMLEMVENDGAGGKPQFFTLLGDEQAFENLGWEIITMTADDLARRGAKPCVIDNEMNVKRLTKANYHFFEAIMRGYEKALAASGLVNITGETAVMKHQITAFCDGNCDNQLVLTWGASCIGLVHRDTLVNPATIEPEMAVIGLLEPGYRCNGGTFFTNLLTHLYGWHVRDCVQGEIGREFVRQLTIPSKSYARFLNRLVGWGDGGQVVAPLAPIAGIAHITGGGVWEKFREILPEGVGANLYCMPPPPEVLLQAQRLALNTPHEIPDLSCYGTFHGGCGALVVCPMPGWEEVVSNAGNYGIDAQLVGITVPSDHREVRILSRFAEGRWLSSDELES